MLSIARCRRFCRRKQHKYFEEMNRAQTIICFCALMLCFVWAGVTTPRMVSNRGSHFDFDSLFNPINLVAWAVILIVAAMVYRAAGKK